MKCISTRGKAPTVSLKEAVLAGLAPDGGLDVPQVIPRLPDSWWSALRGKSFHDIAIAMALELAGDEFDHATLTNLVRDALNFPVRIVELEPGLGVLELFHGPTFAFKDFGARTLARLMALSELGGDARTGDLTVLVATSGDTGSAVANAFLGVSGTRVVVLYPDGKVSDVQEAQFTTLGGNVTAVAVAGTFDDCQRLAKEAFADSSLRSRLRLTSANSISLGRLLPQTFYYGYAALHSPADKPLTISVPSGNFGNLAAGVIAWKMGAPIHAFTAPTTINDTVPRYFASGRVEPKPSVQTLANAMDVGNPSNLERLQWLFDGDLPSMQAVITTRSYTDEEVRRAIILLFDKYQYVADPHTAIGFLGSEASLASAASPASHVFLSTAHPSKFREVVEPVIGTPVPLPDALAETLARKKVMQRIKPDLGRARKVIMIERMSSPAAPVPSTVVPARETLDQKYTWDLSSIFTSWDAWEQAFTELDRGIEAYKKYEGTLAQGADQLLRALTDRDTLGQSSYKVWYYPSLQYDEDQRNNTINARRQRVQLLIAKWQQATSWFQPELLKLPLATVREWMDATPGLSVYRFAIEEVFRLQEHVLNEQGERLLSLTERVGSVPRDTYAALSTADARFPTVTLSTGETTQVSYGQYRKLLATCRSQADRRTAYEALYDTYIASLNTYATIYNGVMHGDWFEARARGYKTTLDAALFGNAIPTTVVENLISETKKGVEPFRRYHRLRKRVLKLENYYVFDAFVPLVEDDVKYRYDEVLDWILSAVSPLGAEYQARVRRAFSERWIDVYENQGKRSGAYSAPVYGANPYMLMNYNDTLEAVFTLAHELGHSMHTMLSHETQPFVYSAYTIFVAEVPSTLNEALLLDFMLARAQTAAERIVLLQHAIDNIVGTFYNQVLFADFELEAHRLVENDQPITSEVLSGIYSKLLGEYRGDALSPDQRVQHTWARIPHFFQSPYYVYQYATCFASTAKLMEEVGSKDPAARQVAVDRYLNLLKSGGSNHPMKLLQTAGVDLSKPETVRAVSAQLDGLVDRLERELA